MVAAAQIGLVAVDGAGRIAWINVAFLAWAGSPALPDPTGRDFAETFPALANQAPGQASGGQPSSGSGLRWTPSPDQGWIGQVAVAVRGSPAPLDELTGLGGRAELHAAFAELVASKAVRRHGVAYLTLDLDCFKEVNDTLGHPVGDELLRRVARRITYVVGSLGAVFRLGGDEFGILLSCSKVEEAAAALAGRLVDVLGRSFVIRGQEVQTGASIGVARVSSDATGIDAAYQEADTALYVSKHAGGGRASLFEPQMARALEERRVIGRDLRRAVLLDQFELHYQPQLDLQAGTISGFEALVRWNHPERGIILPAAFMPVAEGTRCMAEINHWVLHEACRTAATWPSWLSVSISFLLTQLTDVQFLATVLWSLQESSLAPERLILEVTGSVLLANGELVGATMAALRRTGVKVSLDDASAGRSSMSLLGQVPFDRVKIDQACRMAGFDAGAAMALIMSPRSGLGRQVVVEGIETTDQLEAARQRGCHVGQGPLIGRPIAKSVVTSFLQDRDMTLCQHRSGGAPHGEPRGGAS